MSWDFFGSKGHLHIDSDGKFRWWLGRNKKPEPEVEPFPEVNHYANFVEAVRSQRREDLNAEIRETHLSTALCHLGNIAYRRGYELRFDPLTERFVSDTEANALLRRTYRAPYVVPDQV
jgi:hypothetical protein